MTRRIEVVKNNGNYKSKYTITPERITIKLRDEDIHREEELVSLAKNIASQIPEDTTALRGSFGTDGSDILRLNSGHLTSRYVFRISTGELLKKVIKTEGIRYVKE